MKKHQKKNKVHKNLYNVYSCPDYIYFKKGNYVIAVGTYRNLYFLPNYGWQKLSQEVIKHGLYKCTTKDIKRVHHWFDNYNKKYGCKITITKEADVA